jgi:hypothetical protein
MKFYSKPVAALLTAFMFWFGFLEYAPAVYAASPANDKIPLITSEGIDRAANEGHTDAKPERCGDYVNVLADPVNPDFQPDPKLYKIFAPTVEPCGDVETKHGWLKNRRLHKDQALAIPLSGTGDPIIVACGNRFHFYGDLVGKYFTCPTLTCPEPQTRTITVEVPGPEHVVDLCRNIDGLQVAVPPGMFLDDNGNCYPRVVEKHKVPWGWIGAGVFAVVAAIGLSHHGKKECTTCCPTCPPRKKPNP